MLILGQPDKMHRDLRHIKGSTELSATSMRNLVIPDIQYVSNLVFSLCTSECLDQKQHTERSLLHCSPCSHFLLTQPQSEGLSHLCLMQPSDSQYLHQSYSLSPLALQHHNKTNTALYLLSGHLNRYMQHHSPEKENHCSMGKFKSPIINNNSNFNTSKGASVIQYNSFNMQLIHQKP